MADMQVALEIDPGFNSSTGQCQTDHEDCKHDWINRQTPKAFPSRTRARGLTAAGHDGIRRMFVGWLYDVLIEELYPTAEGGVWIKTTGDETLANCTANSNVFLRLNVSAGYKDIYSTLLAAMLAEKRVSLRIVEGSNPPAPWRT